MYGHGAVVLACTLHRMIKILVHSFILMVWFHRYEMFENVMGQASPSRSKTGQLCKYAFRNYYMELSWSSQALKHPERGLYFPLQFMVHGKVDHDCTDHLSKPWIKVIAVHGQIHRNRKKNCIGVYVAVQNSMLWIVVRKQSEIVV